MKIKYLLLFVFILFFATEAFTKEQSAKERIAKERIAKEQLARERIAKEQLAKEQFAREQLAKEQLAKEQLAKERIVDNAKVLGVGEKVIVSQKLNSIALKYNFDLFIVTEKSISKPKKSYAQNVLITQGYGSTKKDAALLLLVTNSRDYEIIATTGRGMGMLNPTAFDKLEKDVVKSLKANEPFNAFLEFAADWEKFLDLESKGRNYNFFYQWNVVLLIVAWVLALIMGFAFVFRWKSQMNTALLKNEANEYIVKDSVVFSKKSDNFLYSKTSKAAQRATKAAFAGAILKGAMKYSGQRSGFGGRGGKY